MNNADGGRPIDWAEAERDAQFWPDEIELMARLCRQGPLTPARAPRRRWSIGGQRNGPGLMIARRGGSRLVCG